MQHININMLQIKAQCVYEAHLWIIISLRQQGRRSELVYVTIAVVMSNNQTSRYRSCCLIYSATEDGQSALMDLSYRKRFRISVEDSVYWPALNKLILPEGVMHRVSRVFVKCRDIKSCKGSGTLLSG